MIYTQAITIKRYAEGSYVNGHYVQGVSISSSAMANIQPLSGAELLLLAKGDREKDTIKVFTNSNTPFYNNDLITYNSTEYRMVKVKNWTDHLIPHYRGFGVAP